MNIKIHFIKSKMILFLFCIIPFSAFAQSTIPHVEMLTTSSEVILIGNVKEAKSFWNNNKSAIHTNVVIETSEYIKGDNIESEVTVTIPGGEIGNVGELYTHMPRFSEDEEVLLFMKKGIDDYSIIGGEYGKITLSNKSEKGTKINISQERIRELKSSITKHLID